MVIDLLNCEATAPAGPHFRATTIRGPPEVASYWTCRALKNILCHSDVEYVAKLQFAINHWNI